MRASIKRKGSDGYRQADKEIEKDVRTGKEIQTLVNFVQSAGKYSVDFDGSKLPSGIYLYKLTTSAGSKSQKMIILK
ncbi:MAG: T9SS type A sorting domain-containing protein [Candidatus Marinimicrobia bacterium]|nr:T9SS type A sorting domain-containing protein [Candidatus Neomarinimicrobiota bacterium]